MEGMTVEDTEAAARFDALVRKVLGSTAHGDHASGRGVQSAWSAMNPNKGKA